MKRARLTPIEGFPRPSNMQNCFFASVVCGSGTASVASHFKLCLQPFWQAVSLKSSHERKLGTWLLSGKGCFGSRLEHLHSSVVPGLRVRRVQQSPAHKAELYRPFTLNSESLIRKTLIIHIHTCIYIYTYIYSYTHIRF